MSERIEYKNDSQIRDIRVSALIVADIHAAMRKAVRPGITTAELDKVALDVLRRHDAKSNFYGYYGYPAQTCISVNDVIVHGIPGSQTLAAGDLVSIDCGAVKNGWHGDAAFSMVVPGVDNEISQSRQRLVEVTETAMWVGIAAMETGKHVGDIGDAIDDYITSLPQDYGIVEEYVGHGIGTAMHQAPDVYNYRTRARGPRLKPGMVLCIEPMITAGSPENSTDADEWTMRTVDGSDAAHVENEVALHHDGIWVLSETDGGAAGLEPFGIQPVPLN